MKYYALTDNAGETRLVFRYQDSPSVLDRFVGARWVPEPNGQLMKHIWDPDGNEKEITQAEAESFKGVAPVIESHEEIGQHGVPVPESELKAL